MHKHTHTHTHTQTHTHTHTHTHTRSNLVLIEGSVESMQFSEEVMDKEESNSAWEIASIPVTCTSAILILHTYHVGTVHLHMHTQHWLVLCPHSAQTLPCCFYFHSMWNIIKCKSGSCWFYSNNILAMAFTAPTPYTTVWQTLWWKHLQTIMVNMYCLSLGKHHRCNSVLQPNF